MEALNRLRRLPISDTASWEVIPDGTPFSGMYFEVAIFNLAFGRSSEKESKQLQKGNLNGGGSAFYNLTANVGLGV
jgi:hypothetical protein